MNIVNNRTQKLKVCDLDVGDVFQFASPWSQESKAQVYIVFLNHLGEKSSLNLIDYKEVRWAGEGHETRLAKVLNTTLLLD